MRKLFGFMMLMSVVCFSGCLAVGQSVGLSYSPSSMDKISVSKSVSVEAVDAREYVVNGTKTGTFIGKFRGGYGNPWNVNTAGKVLLADQFQKDVLKSLEAKGVIARTGKTQRVVKVVINDYNFDAYMNAKYWYDVDVQVLSGSKVVFSKNFKEEHTIKGNVMTGPMSAVKKQVPVLYSELIDEMIAKNKGLLKALS